MPHGGVRTPLRGLGNFWFDPTIRDWVPGEGVGGVMSINMAKWGGVVVSGDDVTLRFRALSDPLIIGLMRSTGDAGAGALDTSGETILRKLHRIAESADNDLVQGLIRSVGDTGAGPINVIGHTVLSLLSQILAAIGVSGGVEWEAKHALGNGAANFTVSLDTGIYGGRTVTHLNAFNAANASTVEMQASYDNVNWITLFTVSIPIGGDTINETFFNAFRYLRVNVSAIGGGTTYVTLGTSR